MQAKSSDVSNRQAAPFGHVALVSIVLFLLSQALFITNIQYPRGYNFDETGYIPAARQFIELKEIKNWEHPPLSKQLMAVGLAVFGDQPLGWRYMSAFFGSLTLVGMYLWALVLFRNKSTALFAALITLANQLLFVQARIGTPEIFMFAFLVFALVFFCAAWSADVEPRRAYHLCIAAGAMFGTATACKWAAIMPWLCAMLMIAVIRVMQRWRTVFKAESPWKARGAGFEDWYSQRLFSAMDLKKFAIAFVVVPVAVYFTTFLPYLLFTGAGVGFFDLIAMQLKMWHGQTGIAASHPYASKWLSWPLMLRPVWYAFDKDPEGFYRCVILLGNPLIMWGGLIALLGCLWAWIACRSREAFLILSFYGAFYIGWAFIPRNITFYYYYFPAGMTLSMALAFCFHHWEPAKTLALGKIQTLRWAFLAACALIFVFFYPVLGASKITLAQYFARMWFRSWI